MTSQPDSPLPEGFELAPCPLCGEDRTRVVVQATDRLKAGDPQTYTVVRCLGCGLGYLRPRPTPEAAARLYPDSYAGGARVGRVERLEALYRDRQHREVVAWLAARRPARGLVLDVGCATGDLLVALRSDGWRTQGVEPMPLGASTAREKHGLDVVTGRFEDVMLPERAYAVIVFSGVLEHIHDPLGALKRARALLVPGGLVAVLFLPMLDSLEARFFGPRWLALDLPRHLTHFDDATFAVLAARAGLAIVARKSYSRRHNAAQLVGSLAPGLQKHRFYAGEAGGTGRTALLARLAPVARRAAFLAATTAARPAARLAVAAGATPMRSYFLEPTSARSGGPD